MGRRYGGGGEVSSEALPEALPEAGAGWVHRGGGWLEEGPRRLRQRQHFESALTQSHSSFNTEISPDSLLMNMLMISSLIERLE